MNSVRFDFEAELAVEYSARMREIRETARRREADLCLSLVSRLLQFMNRFRNCNLKKYFDEELHEVILSLNEQRYCTKHLVNEKSEFRIAFVFNRFNDTGGAAFTHRYMLESYPAGSVKFKQYVLITNDANEAGYEHSERYQYMRDRIDVEEVLFLEPDSSTVRKADKAAQWLFENQIDFAIVQPSPLTLYAIASKPVAIAATFSADCHVFTLGPGTGDFTFYVENDQVYKYKFKNSAMDERRVKNILLPLPPPDYIRDAVPIPRTELGVPEYAIVSATTNMWKCSFGDTETLYEGLAILLRRFPRYFHIFLGTQRSSDSLEFFLNKNPDLKGRLRYVGAYPYIYRVLKSVDFFVNSFPVSGATNTEIAMLAKPSIDLFSHRNLSFHNTEFLRSNECAVCSLDEFVGLGARFISDKSYRDNLGAWLKDKVGRDLDKSWLAKDRIYDAFLAEFQARLTGTSRLPALGVEDTIEMEKRIAFFSAHAREKWDSERRWSLLAECRTDFPERPFGWVAGLEEVIRTDRADRLFELEAALPAILLKDTRIRVMLAIAHDRLGELTHSISHALCATDLAIYDKVAHRLAARLLIKSGRDAEASAILGKIINERLSGASLTARLNELPEDKPPLYYAF